MTTQEVVLSKRLEYINKNKIFSIININIEIFRVLFISDFHYIIHTDFSDLFFYSNVIKSQLNRRILDKCLGIYTDDSRIIKSINNAILSFNEN